MKLSNYAPLVFACLPAFTLAQVTQDDLLGPGEIWVLDSDDWRTANPSQKVGCLSNSGRFINPKDKNDATDLASSEQDKGSKECGVFEKLTEYPYTISSREGNCTFNDQSTERNTDSHYGKNDHAWSCNPKYVADVYDGLYTVDGFPYPFLCWGDLTCYYDAAKIPSKGKNGPLWQFRWGSQQLGITPGHVMLQLMWHKVGDASKREGAAHIPGPRVEIKDDLQVPLLGKEIRS